MENKYYTPSIEEFHVGFEFESNYILFRAPAKEDSWHKIILGEEHDWFLNSYRNDAVSTEFRVRYLNREDIESLGFKKEENIFDLFSKTVGYRGDRRDCKLFYNFNMNWMLIYFNEYIDSHVGSDRGASNTTIFAGKIKNISELRVLLKQLNIND